MLRSQADARLVDLVRAGNDRAFEAIVARYRRPLLRYCGRILSPSRAEDAVQQAFLNAYRAIKADERSIDLRPWLYRIAHNASLNALRAAGPATSEIDEQADGVERPDQAFERRERLRDLVAAVRSLPPRQRDAIILREIEGRSYEQIAAELSISDGAVRQLLNRARTTLRAGATALVPEALIVRLATSGSEPVATRVAEIVAAGGGGAIVLKAGTAVVVAGAVATGAAEGPPTSSDGRAEQRPQRSTGNSNSAAAAGAAARVPVTHGERAVRRQRSRAQTQPTRERHSDEPRGAAAIRRDEDRRGGRSLEDDDRPGRGDDRFDADDRADDRRPDDDARSGPGDGTLEVDGDRSGPGGGSFDEDRSGSNSGPGSGSDDPIPVAPAPDPPDESLNSGPGGGEDRSDSSGPGSGEDADR